MFPEDSVPVLDGEIVEAARAYEEGRRRFLQDPVTWPLLTARAAAIGSVLVAYIHVTRQTRRPKIRVDHPVLTMAVRTFELDQQWRCHSG